MCEKERAAFSFMGSHSTGIIVTLVILVILSAYFSATETAFSSLNRIRLKSLAEQGDRRAKLAYRLSQNYDELLSSILIGNNIVNIAATSLATLLFIRFFGDSGPTVSTVVMTVIVLICGEVTPKGIAKEMPEKFAMFSAPVIHVLNYVFKPLNVCLLAIRRFAGRFFKNTGDRTISESELLTLVDEAQLEGGINENESELIHNVIEFDDLEAIDIFTPRVDVEAVALDAPVEEVKQRFAETNFSRLPVFEESIDSIVGILNEKDFHNRVLTDGAPLSSIVKPVEVIPPSMKISALLKLFQQKKSHLAVIVDEFGGTEGIVTLEDIVEELVGEIWDEHDEVVEVFRPLGENQYSVDCSVDLEDFLEFFGVSDDDDSSTLNGWVMAKLDRVPQVGDAFDFASLHIAVESTDGPRAVRVRVTKETNGDEIK